MSKKKKRRQIVLPFERNQDTIQIDVINLKAKAAYNGHDPFHVVEFIECISKCAELKEQLSVSQQYRNKIKVYFFEVFCR